jgi:RsiW-degrading membrane proteinase PrsW (M82 family)
MDPLVLKYLAGGGVLLLATVLVWADKIDKTIVSTLLLGAAAAVGFQLTP